MYKNIAQLGFPFMIQLDGNRYSFVMINTKSELQHKTEIILRNFKWQAKLLHTPYWLNTNYAVYYAWDVSGVVLEVCVM